MTNFSKLRKYQTSGLIELHNLSKVQLADRLLKLWKSCVYDYWSAEHSDFLIFPTFKQLLSKILLKNFQVSKNILKVLINFYRFTNIYDLKFLDTETTALWIFFEICTEERFASYILSNEWNIKVSILLILLKCIAVGYSNGNESFIARLFSKYGSFNMLFHFFRYLIYSVFHWTFFKQFMKRLFFFQLKFQQFIPRYGILQKIRMSNFVILKSKKGRKLKNLSIFWAVFSEIKDPDILNISWIKFL